MGVAILSDLEVRVRKIMKREALTYQQLSEYADVTVQAVHRWLSSGSISDVKARTIAREIGIDWLWLKHGITRLPLETFHDVVVSSTDNLILTCWDTLELLAVGGQLAEEFEYEISELLGKSTLHLVPTISEAQLRRGQKVVHALAGAIDHSFRFYIQDKYSVRPYLLRGRGITSDNDGLTYAIGELQQVEPDGTEGSLRSVRFKRRSPISLSDEDLAELVKRFPEFPSLSDI